MAEESCELDDLAALLDEDDEELLAMVTEEVSASKAADTNALLETSESGNQELTALTEVGSACKYGSNTEPALHNEGPHVSNIGLESVKSTTSMEVEKVKSDLSLSDEEIDEFGDEHVTASCVEKTPDVVSPSKEHVDNTVVDDTEEAEIHALEAKLAALKQKRLAKTSPKSLTEVVSRIKKPPTPNKSKFLDTTGIVPSTSVPVSAPSSSSTSEARAERIRALIRQRAPSAVHSGDTDSSDDEENRTPFETKYNEFGRTVKRIAHGAASGATREQLQQKAETVNRAAVRELKPKVRARAATAGVPAAPEQECQQVLLDSFARMSVTNPRLTASELTECMRDKQLIRISQLEGHVRGDVIPGDWVTIGCVARKSDPRTSQKGSSYSSWTLTDLVDCQKPLKVMLFGDAHAGLWKTAVGTVVALASCKIMKEREMNGTGVTISLNSKQHCIVLGTSPDLDFCKAKCKNGRVCLSFINKRHCPVCVFHMNAEYKKTGAKRGELQGHCSVTPKGPRLGAAACGAAGPLLHEGQLRGGDLAKHSASAAQRLADRQRLQGLQLQRQMADSLHAKKKLNVEGFKHINDAEAKAIKHVAGDSLELGELLLKPCAGARNMLKHLTAEASGGAGAGSSDLAATDAAPAARLRGDPAALLRAEAADRRAAAAAAPRLAADLTPGQMVDLDTRPAPADRRTLAAKARAIALVRRTGGVKRPDPNRVRGQADDDARQRVLKRIPHADENADASQEGGGGGDAADPEQDSKRRRLAADARVRAALAARSSHAAQLQAELSQQEMDYFTALEKKELLENKMLSTWEMKTKAVYCKQCKYKALSASELCKTEGHTTLTLDAVKRFFACRNCKQRTVTLDRLPRQACRHCGQDRWQRAPLGKERSGPKLENEILSIRGNEAKHITAHVKEHNLNLDS